MDIAVTQLPPGDPRLVEAIVGQLKSKGIFDQFRKECLADVDTKPAFQNLRQRVEGHVNKFLETKTWKNDMNKNQLRDGVRKHVNSLGILDSGIDAIITQVVNPKIKPLILPYVEDTVYAFLQIDKPKREKQDSIKEPQEEQIHYQIPETPEVKPDLLPMETDVISSEEDDILARESPESNHKSSPPSETSFLKEEDEDAQDGFESYTTPAVAAETTEESVTSQVERLHITQDTEDSKVNTSTPVAKTTLPLFDDQSLDSISSNSSGLTFSTLSGKGSLGSKKSMDNMDKSEGSPGMVHESRSTTSTPLVDEKPIEEDISQSSLESDPTKDYLSSDIKYGDTITQYGVTAPNTESLSGVGASKDDQIVASESMALQGDESQESKGSASKVSTLSEKSEEKVKYEKSEGEISSSSPEVSDSENKGRHSDHRRSEEKHSSDSSSKSRKSRSDHKSKRDSHSHEREREKDKHYKDKERKHSKPRDDHHSHRDKDKKHHRRDKDHDGDRDRPRSHHTSRDGSGVGSGSGSSSSKSSGDREKDRSSHHSSDKSTEGKSRRDKSSSKGGNKPTEASEGKLEGSSNESNDSKSSTKSDLQSDKSDSRSNSKSDSKSDGKSSVKSDSKSESKSSNSKSEEKAEKRSDSKSHSEKSERKHDSHSSKHSSSKSKKEGERSSSDKHRSSSKDDRKRKEDRDDKKERSSDSKSQKSSRDSKSDKEEKESRHNRDSKKSTKEDSKLDKDKYPTKDEKQREIGSDTNNQSKTVLEKDDAEGKQIKDELKIDENMYPTIKENKRKESNSDIDDKSKKLLDKCEMKKDKQKPKLDETSSDADQDERPLRSRTRGKQQIMNTENESDVRNQENASKAKPKKKSLDALQADSDANDHEEKYSRKVRGKERKAKLNKTVGVSDLDTEDEWTLGKRTSSRKRFRMGADPLVIENEDGNLIVLTYEDKDTDAPSTSSSTPSSSLSSPQREQGISDEERGRTPPPIITGKKHKIIGECENNNIDKGDLYEFEGFETWEVDKRLSNYLQTTKRVPDEMDMEFGEWFDDADLHMEVTENNFGNVVEYKAFLSCMKKLGAVINHRDGESEAQTVSEPSHFQPPAKRRRTSTSSSASSSTSQSGSPQHRRITRQRLNNSSIQENNNGRVDCTHLLEQPTVTPAGYLLTPEDDGNRTSSRDYEVDYSQRISTYSPLSPASDSSADDGKAKTGDSGSTVDVVAGRPRMKGSVEAFKSASNWSSEGNISV
ncbi:hypothetical protein Pmani_033111 [Petrolisthes manimaculis]|uniref:BOD1/SHG1 domain-containing protein n=1 Tax=Petrolisthes manimaculis TaxID=1843537 RepID=A0AAE1NSH2_9EUCA|nr:hypothetical protein Pmani_033111 [Petrolisthes manimaculis]